MNNPGTNSLRGLQKTNANGIATFETIYPGFYAGRAVHIHVKVHVRGSVVHTGQLFFPAAATEAVHAKDGGRLGMRALRKTAAGYRRSITMGVHA